MLSAERAAVVRLPLVCVAVHADGGLEGVFPCSAGGEATTRTVRDCLDRLEAGAIGGKSDLRVQDRE